MLASSVDDVIVANHNLQESVALERKRIMAIEEDIIKTSEEHAMKKMCVR